MKLNGPLSLPVSCPSLLLTKRGLNTFVGYEPALALATLADDQLSVCDL